MTYCHISDAYCGDNRMDAKPVYTFNYEGVTFLLMPDGKVLASVLDENAEEVGRLTFSDTGNPWIPKHKNFNSLCRQMVRDGELDDMLKRKSRHKHEVSVAKSHAVELLAALESVLAGGDTSDARALLTTVRSEQRMNPRTYDRHCAKRRAERRAAKGGA